ncbi:hypothetical protein [Janthinobacterium sp. 64]|uniref:hypothetical protein n=1 Tax=Janthinobacterium sp. 64 TaxID=2035208 RepID=UPI0012FE5219|nr:hypothetical protein [Janthinobacterium sp. 64]
MSLLSLLSLWPLIAREDARGRFHHAEAAGIVGQDAHQLWRCAPGWSSHVTHLMLKKSSLAAT